MRKWLGMILALALTAALLSGAALADEPAAEETAGAESAVEEPAEEDFEGLDRLGEETEGCVMVRLTNLTGADIRGMNVKRSDDWQWSEELVAKGDVFVTDEVCALCYEPEADTAEEEAPEETDPANAQPAPEETDPANAQPAPEAGETDEAGEADQPVLYDLQIVFSDRSLGICHGLDLNEVKDAKIMRAWNGVVYLVYTSASTGEEMDMSEAEQAIAAGEMPAPGSDTDGANTEGCVGDSGLFY